MPRHTGMLRAFKQRNYRLWAAADLLSVAGTWMQVLGVNWLLLSISGSATSLGLGLFLQSAPTLLLSMVGGSLADRLPARPLVIVGQAFHGLLAAALAAIAFTGLDSTGPIYLISALGGVVTAFCAPAIGRFAAETVEREDLSNALGLGSVISSAARILGMGVAGALIPVIGTAALFAANALSFAGVIVAVLLMRTAEMRVMPRASRAESKIADGLRYMFRTPWLLVVFALSFALGSLGRNYQLTMAAMTQGPLDAGAGGYGLLSVVFAIGAIVGGLIAASRPRLGFRVLLVSGAFISVLQGLSGLTPGLPLFAALILLIAAGAVIVDTTVAARVQLGTREDMRGRVLAAQSMVGAAAGATGGPLLGILCDTAGPRVALVLAGVVTTAVTLTAAVLLVRILGVRPAVFIQFRPTALAQGLAP